MAPRDGGAIVETPREVGLAGAIEPFADGLFGDGEGRGASAEGGASGEVMGDHFGSHERGECGISVHSVRVGWLGVESASTTNLPDPQSADNVLKHDINHTLQPTPGGVFSSASRFMFTGPAWLSLGR